MGHGDVPVPIVEVKKSSECWLRQFRTCAAVLAETTAQTSLLQTKPLARRFGKVHRFAETTWGSVNEVDESLSDDLVPTTEYRHQHSCHSQRPCWSLLPASGDFETGLTFSELSRGGTQFQCLTNLSSVLLDATPFPLS